jgi:hypothetical protein
MNALKTFGLSVSLVLSACAGVPCIENVRVAFAREHRYVTVTSMSEQLTDGHADFHIHYVMAGDKQEHEEVWHYYHPAEGWLFDKKEQIR